MVGRPHRSPWTHRALALLAAAGCGAFLPAGAAPPEPVEVGALSVLVDKSPAIAAASAQAMNDALRGQSATRPARSAALEAWLDGATAGERAVVLRLDPAAGLELVEIDAAEAPRLVDAAGPETRFELLGEREPALRWMRPTLGIARAWRIAGRGEGVRVGLVEIGGLGRTTDTVIPFLRYGGCADTWHATMVGGVIALRPAASWNRGYDGIASSVRLLDAGACSARDRDLFAAIDWALVQGASVLNLSWGTPTGGAYDAAAALVDEIAWSRGTVIVAAAGNDAGAVWSPALAHGALAVGATDDRDTESVRDDAVAGFSSWIDPRTGSAKPELVAPGAEVTTAAPGYQALARASGTSLAAPAVSAVAALLLGARPDLAGHGPAVRALLLASAGLQPGATDAARRPGDRAGEGYPRAEIAAESAAEGRCGWLDLVTADAGTRRVLTILRLKRGQQVRAAIAWDQPGRYHAAGLGAMADLDLALVTADGRIVAESRTATGSYEALSVRVPASGEYRLVATVFRHDSLDRAGRLPGRTPLGWAWALIPSTR
ncbi:MAG: S8 family serine peptidase [Acidobacteria bacterium]|nr:S8 family serine peptidase [Acidobacteriota bacterium]